MRDYLKCNDGSHGVSVRQGDSQGEMDIGTMRKGAV